MLLMPLTFDTTPNKAPKERVLNIELKSNETEASELKISPDDQITDEEDVKTETKVEPPTVTENSPKIEIKPETLILRSTIQQWAKQDSSEYIDKKQKTDLSKLRKNSYTEKWLRPDRIDTRDSDEDTIIRTPDGPIRISKVNGQLVCNIVEHDGRSRYFNCGDPILNVLLDESGSVKNSDREEWQFDD